MICKFLFRGRLSVKDLIRIKKISKTLGPVHVRANCRLITDKSHCAENGLVGWRWAAGGKCLVWAAVMVVPLSLSSFPPFAPFFPVSRCPQPICSCLASQVFHQVDLSN